MAGGIRKMGCSHGTGRASRVPRHSPAIAMRAPDHMNGMDPEPHGKSRIMKLLGWKRSRAGANVGHASVFKFPPAHLFKEALPGQDPGRPPGHPRAVFATEVALFRGALASPARAPTASAKHALTREAKGC